tara:strand:- start:149 stop:421 length:273 start_codon:yes stop_codon:yes gene_type:complete
MSKLMAIVKKLQATYVTRMLKAPTKGSDAWNFGIKSATKSELRKAYMTDLRNIVEVAVQNNDQDVIDFCKGCVEDDESVEDLQAQIKGAK